MTEPNVLGNVSPAKFIWENGNTEIINLWKKTDTGSGGNVDSFYHENASTVNGQAYIVPVSRVFWLLDLHLWTCDRECELALQSNTSVDTSVGGTTKARFRFPTTEGTSVAGISPFGTPVCVKFVAGEYITPYDENSGSFYCSAWGVECDA